MARKINMNLFEAHVEKLAMGLAAVAFLLVLYLGIISPAEIADKSPYEAAREAQKKVESLKGRLSEPLAAGEGPQLLADTGGIDEIIKSNGLEEIRVDIAGLPVYQMYPGDGGPKDNLEIRLPEVTEVAQLTAPKMQFTRARAMIPEEVKQDQTAMAGMGMGMGMGMPGMGMTAGGVSGTAVKDIDFVSVEAAFDMAAWREEFRKRMTSADIQGVELLDTTAQEAVVAVVELQRMELLEDGQWVGPIVVSRLKNDPMAKFATAQELASTPHAALKVKMQQTNDKAQLALLQPKGYDLVGTEQWKPKTQSSSSSGRDRDNNRRNNRNQRQNQPNDMGMGMPGMGMPGMDGMGMGMPGVGMGNTTDAEAQAEFAKKDMLIWAHDDSVEPGHVYKYSMRVGFFNPIAKSPRFVAAQKELQSAIILWSNWVEPGNLIQIPPRTVFYPKASTSKKDNTKVVRFEVVHYHADKWLRETFDVAVGSEIGSVLEKTIVAETDNRRGGRAAAGDMGMGMPGMGMAGAAADPAASGKQEVDYRTGAILLDIIPDSVHWVKSGSKMVKIVCDDIAFRQSDGKVVRLGTDKKTWPDEFDKMIKSARD
ncbi:MAG: hypothetical protein JEZ07_08235 [Phycisphaerae bacterium]|nr:hypothetical protein [Phycisphaerae bacterium]